MNKFSSEIDFDKIPIDTAWNVGEEKENKMHKIHSYPAKFPAFITTNAIRYAEEKGIKINTVADVFCGCGTSAYESKRNRKNFWGCDINPIATLIAKTKSHKYDSKKITDYYNNIRSEYEKIRISNDEVKNINERIKYWFYDEQIYDLLRLKKSIFNFTSNQSRFRDFFLCAFSNILKPTSKWLTKSIKPQIDPDKNPKDVITAFEDQIQLMIRANESSDLNNLTEVNIINANFLSLEIENPFAELLVTSPPYVTSYEYADLHQLSILWLKYKKDYKKYRTDTIGSLYHKANYGEIINDLSQTAKECIDKLYEVDKNKTNSVAKYFYDMKNSVIKCHKIIKSGGIVLFVIGNTEYKNVRITNAEHLFETMKCVGFKDIEVKRRKISKKILTPYRDSKGKFTTDSNSRKVYSEEYIIIGEK